MRFTAPEFTSLCPITGQPDFAHLVIDYAPEAVILESKSLKLFLGSFRNHGAFHEDCTVAIARRLVAALQAALAAHRRILVSARRHPDRRVLSNRRPARWLCFCPSLGSRPIAAGDEAGRTAILMTAPADIREAIRAEALAIGFDAVGFAAAHLGEQARADLRAYIERGYHGDMGWLAEHVARRGDPRVLWPEARTVVVLGVNYGPEDDPLAGADDPERGMISVYARSRDYHDTIKKRLKALARWIVARWPGELKVFVDTAPVMEKPLAQIAGIGWQGKHTNLVSRDFGSWLFLGEIYLSLALPPDPPEADHCGACRRCLDICPTDAFPAPYRLDARRCISYLTIEHKGPIPRELRPLIGNRIYGCDDCLAVCPGTNSPAPPRNRTSCPAPN